MAKGASLSASEEEMWRALMRIVKTLPRDLDTDLVRSTGLTASDYTALMHLSEAPNRELRMADLAEATGLSASRTTRTGGRPPVTRLGDQTRQLGRWAQQHRKAHTEGMAKLKSAWPAHLASVRKRVFDHIDASAVQRTAHVLSAVAAQLED